MGDGQASTEVSNEVRLNRINPRRFRPGVEATCYGSSADLDTDRGTEGEREDF